MNGILLQPIMRKFSTAQNFTNVGKHIKTLCMSYIM